MDDEPYNQRLDVSEVIIWFDDVAVVKRLAWEVRDRLKDRNVTNSYNHCLGHTARMFGNPSYNRFLSTLGTCPPLRPLTRSLRMRNRPDASNNTSAFGLHRLDREQAVNVIQRCGFGRWLAFSERN